VGEAGACGVARWWGEAGGTMVKTGGPAKGLAAGERSERGVATAPWAIAKPGLRAKCGNGGRVVVVVGGVVPENEEPRELMLLILLMLLMLGKLVVLLKPPTLTVAKRRGEMLLTGELTPWSSMADGSATYLLGEH
jgi:hypothetical protein